MKFSKRKKKGLCAVRFCRGQTHSTHKLCSKHMMRRWRERYPIKAAFSAIRCGARSRGIAFTITLEEFTQLIEGTGYIYERGVESEALHIDRIDPTKGYEPGNLQVVTASYNIEKGNRERWEKIRQMEEEDSAFPF